MARREKKKPRKKVPTGDLGIRLPDPLKSRAKAYAPRILDTRDQVPQYLIVCEGERTEPNYFRSFRVAKAVRDGMKILGTGYNTISLVEEAIRLRVTEGPFDRTWCVFDTDSFPEKNIREAVALAELEGIRVACSNEAFELWYFLHFHYLDTGITRDDYVKRLSTLLGKRYEKNSREIYDLLLTRQTLGISHARRLLANYPEHKPATDKPSTTVHLLVEELNQHLEL